MMLMIDSEGWKEEIQKHTFVVNLENRSEMEDNETEESSEEEQIEEFSDHEVDDSSHSEIHSDVDSYEENLS